MQSRPYPKYSIGDKVFYMSDNIIEEEEVMGLRMLYENYPKADTFMGYTYYTKDKYNGIVEDRLFPTKQALLDTL